MLLALYSVLSPLSKIYQGITMILYFSLKLILSICSLLSDLFTIYDKNYGQVKWNHLVKMRWRHGKMFALIWIERKRVIGVMTYSYSQYLILSIWCLCPGNLRKSEPSYGLTVKLPQMTTFLSVTHGKSTSIPLRKSRTG